jgi:hypothetical protein
MKFEVSQAKGFQDIEWSAYSFSSLTNDLLPVDLKNK